MAFALYFGLLLTINCFMSNNIQADDAIGNVITYEIVTCPQDILSEQQLLVEKKIALYQLFKQMIFSEHDIINCLPRCTQEVQERFCTTCDTFLFGTIDFCYSIMEVSVDKALETMLATADIQLSDDDKETIARRIINQLFLSIPMQEYAMQDFFRRFDQIVTVLCQQELQWWIEQ